MKKIILSLSALALAASFSSAFATMYIEARTSNVSDPSRPFEGIIHSVHYYHQTIDYNQPIGQTIKPTISVWITDANKNEMSIIFQGDDLTTGTAFLNAIGKPLVVEFDDTEFKVGGVFTYDNSGQENNGRIKTNLADLHKKFQENKK